MTISYSTVIDPRTSSPSTVSFSRTNADGSVSYIPVDWLNADYQSYLAWVAADNTALSGIPLLSPPAQPSKP